MIITGVVIFNAQILFPNDFRRGLAKGCGEMRGGKGDSLVLAVPSTPGNMPWQKQVPLN